MTPITGEMELEDRSAGVEKGRKTSDFLGKKSDWQIGDTAWIYGVGNPFENPRLPGTIVHSFVLPGWVAKTVFYVVEIETSIEPIHYVRHSWSMWPYAEYLSPAQRSSNHPEGGK